MVHHPEPWITCCLLRLSQFERKVTPAMSKTTPPPKKPAACGISCREPAIKSKPPKTLKEIPRNFPRKGAKALGKTVCAFAPLRGDPSVIDPASRLRVD